MSQRYESAVRASLLGIGPSPDVRLLIRPERPTIGRTQCPREPHLAEAKVENRTDGSDLDVRPFRQQAASGYLGAARGTHPNLEFTA
jgi:hypothetical protein